MGRSRYIRQLPMQVSQQIGRMRDLYPGLALTSWREGLIQWSGRLQPTDQSDQYLVAIDYRLGQRPKVYVRTPELFNHKNGEPIPHLFPDGALCLYLTNSGEWSSGDALAETTVPWACLWLYHYEVWHATGLWMGGGVHPRRRRKR